MDSRSELQNYHQSMLGEAVLGRDSTLPWGACLELHEAPPKTSAAHDQAATGSDWRLLLGALAAGSCLGPLHVGLEP